MRKAWNAIEWSPEMVDFLKANHQFLTNSELAARLGLKLTSVRTKCYELGLYKMLMQYWTDEQVQFLIENYKTKGDTELAEMFAARWQKDKGWSKKHIEKKRRYLKLRRTDEEKDAIREGHRQRGVYVEGNRKMWRTRGTRAVGHRAIWEGESYTKTECGYVHTRIIEWEKAHGPVPAGKLVCHKDGNKLNCEPENLILLTRQENVIKSRSRLYDGTNLTTLLLLSRLNRKIKQTKKRIENGKKQVTGS